MHIYVCVCGSGRGGGVGHAHDAHVCARVHDLGHSAWLVCMRKHTHGSLFECCMFSVILVLLKFGGFLSMQLRECVSVSALA